MRVGLLALLGLLACDGSLVRSADDFGPFLVLSGRLDSALADASIDDPGSFRGGVAWLVVADDRLGVTWQPTALEPRLFGYAMDIAGPPDLDDVVDAGPAPRELRLGGTRVAVGLPVLHVEPSPALDADALLLWALGALPDPSPIFAAPSTARAVTPGHVLGVVGTSRDVATLSEHPEFVDEAPWCRWARFEPGLAVYRDDGRACDAWRSIAYAVEYQGVDMESVGSEDPRLRP
ncbi:MAG: hypothetical protein AAF602_20530 [Myxococcota bacterium]